MPKEDTSVAHIVSYLEKNLKKGYKIEDLRWALVNQKHSRIEIDKAIKIIEARTPKREEPKIEPIRPVERQEIIMPPKKSLFKRFFGLD